MEFQCTRRDSIGNNVNQTCQEKACDRKYYGSLKCYLYHSVQIIYVTIANCLFSHYHNNFVGS